MMTRQLKARIWAVTDRPGVQVAACVLAMAVLLCLPLVAWRAA